MSIILGIDPGSRITGYGLIRDEGQRQIYIDCGCIKTTGETIPQRLEQIFTGLREVILQHAPQSAAIEEVFMHKNPNSALKLGQARGAAIVAVGVHHIPLSEYSARQVKLSVVGYGAAKKEQVQHMVRQILAIKTPLQEDASDALAIALTHCYLHKTLERIGAGVSLRRGRLK